MKSFKYRKGLYSLLFASFNETGRNVLEKRPSSADFRDWYIFQKLFDYSLLRENILTANLHVSVDEDESAPGEIPHLIGQIDEGGVVEGWVGLLHTPIN
jgi:hypothetical protein